MGKGGQRGPDEGHIELLAQHARVRPLPSSISEAMKVLPEDALQIRPAIAWMTAVRVVIQAVFGVYLVMNAPWYLLPPAWFVCGTCWTGLFVVGHDCAHQAFSKSRLTNEVVGSIVMAPLGFPYNAWEATHNHHHAYANNLDKDSLWRPLRQETVDTLPRYKKSFLYYFFGPLFFQSSILHHLVHFNLFMFKKRKWFAVGRSIVIAIAGASTSIYLAAQHSSWVSLWLMPFLVFQFWLSTFTYFHHRHPKVGWKEGKDWDKLVGGLFSTVHVDYPAWVEWLTLDINWHIPHHLSSSIPWYNLRRCTYSLLQAYGDAFVTEEITWSFWREITTSCHVHDDEVNYKPIFPERAQIKDPKTYVSNSERQRRKMK